MYPCSSNTWKSLHVVSGPLRWMTSCTSREANLSCRLVRCCHLRRRVCRQLHDCKADPESSWYTWPFYVTVASIDSEFRLGL